MPLGVERGDLAVVNSAAGVPDSDAINDYTGDPWLGGTLSHTYQVTCDTKCDIL